MAQILPPKYNSGAALGSTIGNLFGSYIEKQNKTAQLQPFVGDKETAQWLQSLPPKEQLSALQWLQKSNAAQPQQQYQQPQEYAPQQMQQQQQPQYQGNQESLMQQLRGPQQINPLQQQQQQDQRQGNQKQEELIRRVQEMQRMAMQPQQQPQQQQSNLPSLKKALTAGANAANPKNVKLSKLQEGYVKGYDTASESLDILNEMEELYNTGEVASGWGGALYPLRSQNAATQRFDQLGQTLAGLLVSQYGTPTNAKIKFTTDQKPGIGQDAEVQRAGIERLKKEALGRMHIAQQRLPRGYFGEQEPQQLGASPRQVNESIGQPEQRSQQQQEQKTQEPTKQKKESEGWIDWASRNFDQIRQIATNNQDEQAQEVAGLYERLSGKPNGTPEQKAAIAQLQSDRGDVPIAPQSMTEEIIQEIIPNLPNMALSGGKFLGKNAAKVVAKYAPSLGRVVATDIAGSYGAKTAKKLGLGTIGQVAGGLIGGAAANRGIDRGLRYLGKGGDIKNLNQALTSAETEMYETEKQLGKDINVNGKEYRNRFKDLHRKIEDSGAIPEIEKKELLKKVKLWEGDVSGTRLNASKIIERKKEINALYGHGSKNYKKFLDNAKKIMVNEAEEIGKDHKQWLDSWKNADKIHAILNYKPMFEQFMNEFPTFSKYIKNPVAQALLGGVTGSIGGAIKGGIPGAGYGALAGATTPLVVGGVNKAIGAGRKVMTLGALIMNKDERVRKAIEEAITAVADRHASQAARSFNKVSNATKKYAQLL